MKRWYGIVLLIIPVILFFGCPGPEPDPHTGPELDEWEYIPLESDPEVLNSAVMNVAENLIENTTFDMEYSLDNEATWYACNSPSTAVTFAAGNQVWVRLTSDILTTVYLGQVDVLTGYDISAAEMYVGENWFDDNPCGAPGDLRVIMFSYDSIGTIASGSGTFTVTAYLSDDKIITAGDYNLGSVADTYSLTAGTHMYNEIDFTVPAVTDGIYYVGLILDSGDDISEITNDNNATRVDQAVEFRLLDPAAPPVGAFKVFNSWGTWNGENVPDGHYWFTYDALKFQQYYVYVYYNDWDTVYTPSVLAVFRINHDFRDECLVRLGLGDPADPVIEKYMQTMNSGHTALYSGPEPFPGNKMVVDITEFAPWINEEDLFLEISGLDNGDADPTEDGTLASFSVEYYCSYPANPSTIVTGGTGTFAADAVTVFTAETAGALTAEQEETIQGGSLVPDEGAALVLESLSDAEIDELIAANEIYDPDKNYNQLVDGIYGTGLKPLTRDEWKNIKRLDGVLSGKDSGILPEEIDNSQSIYFPPVGDQGSKGTCVAFSMSYYTQTYNEAREHGWDLSGATWVGGSTGNPDPAYQDRIFSPDFLYHMANSGVDGGSSYTQIGSLIVRLGGATWEEMPYDLDNCTAWPSEAAFREAPLYRGKQVADFYWDYNRVGFFRVTGDAQINLIRQLLSEGYLLSLSIEAAIYGEFTDQDVITTTTTPYSATNHAQTIVGYKEGAEWDVNNPED